jgi:hypothetical protein
VLLGESGRDVVQTKVDEGGKPEEDQLDEERAPELNGLRTMLIEQLSPRDIHFAQCLSGCEKLEDGHPKDTFLVLRDSSSSAEAPVSAVHHWFSGSWSSSAGVRKRYNPDPANVGSATSFLRPRPLFLGIITRDRSKDKFGEAYRQGF